MRTVAWQVRFLHSDYQEKDMTEKEKKKFYNSKRWKHKRIEILDRDHHECQDCVKRLHDAVKNSIILPADERKIRKACEVHHIKELSERPDLALDNDNLISLCVQCHNSRHGRTVKKFCKKKEPISKEMW